MFKKAETDTLQNMVCICKLQGSRVKSVKTDDFRGIAISAVISKVFEHCILDRFGCFLNTTDNQFGFKKGLACTDAIYTVRKTVERFINGGSTVNLCALDLTKAFDEANRHALYIKIMQRRFQTHYYVYLKTGSQTAGPA